MARRKASQRAAVADALDTSMQNVQCPKGGLKAVFGILAWVRCGLRLRKVWVKFWEGLGEVLGFGWGLSKNWLS